MNSGLREYWGLSEPLATNSSSSEQAKKFRASFDTAVASVNRSLQYTAANAATAAYDPLRANRDNVYTAYQAVVGSVNSANPAQAQSNIDRVLAAVGNLSSKAASLQQTTERTADAWKSRQAEFATANDQVLQLEEQRHEKAPVLRRVIEAIQAVANERRWPECLQSLDKLLPKLAAIHAATSRQAKTLEQDSPEPASDNSRVVSTAAESAAGGGAAQTESNNAAWQATAEGESAPRRRITSQEREAARRWFEETEQHLRSMAAEFGISV